MAGSVEAGGLLDIAGATAEGNLKMIMADYLEAAADDGREPWAAAGTDTRL